MHFKGDFDDILSQIDDIDINLEKSLTKINQQVNSMQSSVFPIYENTRQLQSLQTNIDRTNKELDDILAHYKILESASAWSKSASESPSPTLPEELGIENYIEICMKLKKEVTLP